MELFIRVALVALSCRAAVVTDKHRHKSLPRPRNNVDDVPTLVAGVVDQLSGQLDALESGQTSHFLIARDADVPGTVVPTTVAQALVRLKSNFKAESAGLTAWVQEDRQRRSNDEAATQAKYAQTSREAAAARHALDLFLNASRNREAPFLLKVAELETEERDIEASLQQTQHDDARDSTRERLTASGMAKVARTNKTLSQSIAKTNISLQMPSVTRKRVDETNNTLLRSSMKTNISLQTPRGTKAKAGETNKTFSRSIVNSNLSLPTPSGTKVKAAETKKALSRSSVKTNISVQMPNAKAANGNITLPRSVAKANKSLKMLPRSVAKANNSLKMPSVAKRKAAETNKTLSRFNSIVRTNKSLQVPATGKPPHENRTVPHTSNVSSGNASQRSIQNASQLHLPVNASTDGFLGRSIQPTSQQLMQPAATSASISPQKLRGTGSVKAEYRLSDSSVTATSKSEREIQEDLHAFLREPDPSAHSQHHRSKTRQRSDSEQKVANRDFIVRAAPVHMSENLRSYLNQPT